MSIQGLKIISNLSNERWIVMMDLDGRKMRFLEETSLGAKSRDPIQNIFNGRRWLFLLWDKSRNQNWNSGSLRILFRFMMLGKALALPALLYIINKWEPGTAVWQSSEDPGWEVHSPQHCAWLMNQPHSSFQLPANAHSWNSSRWTRGSWTLPFVWGLALCSPHLNLAWSNPTGRGSGGVEQ